MHGWRWFTIQHQQMGSTSFRILYTNKFLLLNFERYAMIIDEFEFSSSPMTLMHTQVLSCWYSRCTFDDVAKEQREYYKIEEINRFKFYSTKRFILHNSKTPNHSSVLVIELMLLLVLFRCEIVELFSWWKSFVVFWCATHVDYRRNEGKRVNRSEMSYKLFVWFLASFQVFMKRRWQQWKKQQLVDKSKEKTWKDFKFWYRFRRGKNWWFFESCWGYFWIFAYLWLNIERDLTQSEAFWYLCSKLSCDRWKKYFYEFLARAFQIWRKFI